MILVSVKEAVPVLMAETDFFFDPSFLVSSAWSSDALLSSVEETVSLANESRRRLGFSAAGIRFCESGRGLGDLDSAKRW